MCMEDIRLGREKRSRVNTASLATGNNAVIPADPSRTGIRIDESAGNTIFISDKPMTATGQGMRLLGTDAQSRYFSVEEYGDFVYGAIFIWTDAAGVTTVSWLDASLYKD